MKKNEKHICIVFLISVLLVLIMASFCGCKKIKKSEKLDFKDAKNEEKVIEKKYRKNESLSAVAIISYLLENEENFIVYEDYLTENFRNKFKTKSDLFHDFYEWDDYKQFGSTVKFGYDGLIGMSINWKNREYGTERYYKVYMTDDGQADDFEIVEDINYDSKTHERLDGKKNIRKEDVSDYLKLYTLEKPDDARFLNPYDSTRVFQEAYDEYMKKKQIPLAPNCQIINKPNIDLIDAGNYKSTECAVGYKCAHIKFKDSSMKYYAINLEFNDNAEFTKIEYVEVNQEEYKKILKTIR